jgi:putative ABC transport system permease protein
VVGALGIANVTLVTVMERTAEIGLRRALGARRRHVAVQFLTESMVIGLIGGIVGAGMGILAIVVISVVRDWTPVVDGYLAAEAPLVGAVVGLLAGGVPRLPRRGDGTGGSPARTLLICCSPRTTFHSHS